MTTPGDSQRDRRGQDEDAGFWTPRPDPTRLTTEAVERATEVFRREIQALREVHDKDVKSTRELVDARFDLSSADRTRLWERVHELVSEYESDMTRLRTDVESRDAAILRLVEQRLTAMDKARTDALTVIDNKIGSVSQYTESQLGSLRAELEQRLSGMDQATKLLADNVTNIAADIEKSARTLKEIIDTRLAAMDEATKLLATNVDKVPFAILQEAGNLKGLIMSKIEDVSHVADEKFKAVDALFASNALALSAALAAQEKAVAAQNESNTLAISKSEASTKETIAANAAQAQTANASLAGQFTDIKDRVIRLESLGVGAAGQRSDQRLNTGTVIAAIAALVAVVSLILYVTKR